MPCLHPKPETLNPKAGAAGGTAGVSSGRRVHAHAHAHAAAGDEAGTSRAGRAAGAMQGMQGKPGASKRETPGAPSGLDAPAGRRGAVTGDVKRAVVGEAAQGKDEVSRSGF